MLQPAESRVTTQTHPSREEGGQQQSYYPQQQPIAHSTPIDQSTPPGLIEVYSDHQTPSHAKATPWKWVTTRELLFILVACSVGAALLRTRDTVFFDLAWKDGVDVTLYRNAKFPISTEKLPPPLVTDVDSDGVTDMVILTYDHKVKIYSFPADKQRIPGDKKTQQTITEKAVADVWDLSGGGRPITIATGYLQPYQSMLQVRRQVITVLTSDWTVLCLDHELKLLWKSRLTEETKEEFNDFSISEATMLVAPVSVLKGDLGVVIVGGREMSRYKPQEDSLKRMRRGALPENEDELLQSLGHYSVFALEGRTGENRWSLTPKDHQIPPAYLPTSSFQHLKLIMHKRLNREGEVSWHQFSSALGNSLPHSWRDSQDTHFSLAHFKRDRKKAEKSPVTDHISKVGDLAVEHIAGLAFGGQQPHSPTEHVQEPNVLLLHSMKGIDVVHLYMGRPLTSLPLSPYHSTHADIDGDGTIDHVHAVVNPGEAGFYDDKAEMGNSPDCYGMATPMASRSRSKHLFKHSICKATHWTETFMATDKWLPALNQAGRKRVDHDITEPLAPVLIESPYHSAPLKLHMGGGGWGVKGIIETSVGAPTPSLSTPSTHHQGTMYDSVFVLSSGRVTSIGPQGEFNWQRDTLSNWDAASEVIYNPEHPTWREDPQQVMFVHGGFTPSATPISLQAYGEKDHILILSWTMMEILSAEDGHILSTLKLPCQPVSSPVVSDFTGDGWNDVIVTCANGYSGFAINRQSGFWQSTIISLFVGVVIVVIAIYTRQRTIGLLPVMKAAQD